MKREVIIVTAVLVPFAALVAAGFYFSPSQSTQSPLPRGGEGQGEGRTASAPKPEPQLPVAIAPDASPPPSPFPPELEAPLTAILPEVRQCFRDQKLKTRREVKVRFTPTRYGGFEKVEIDEQNPYLQACLEDVFAEVTWHPDGRQTWEPAAHTFSFDPSLD